MPGMAHLLPQVHECQNCGTVTGANYCPECGQDSRDHSVSMRLLLRDFATDVFTYDSRFFRSFVPLLFRPGALTVEYTRGRRVRYIPPLRLYVFVSLAFFFVVSVQVNREVRSNLRDDRGGLPDSTLVSEVLELAAAAPDSLAAGPRAAWVAERYPLAAAIDFEVPQDGDWSQVDWSSIDWDGERRGDNTVNVTMFGDDRVEVETGRFVQAMMSLTPKLVFLLLPLFAALLALVYLRRRRPFIEHLVLSLHLHAFMFLLLTLAIVTGRDWAFLIALALIHVYIFLALRKVYAQGWRKTAVKFLLLTGAYNIILLTVTILTVVSAATLFKYGETHPFLIQWILG